MTPYGRLLDDLGDSSLWGGVLAAFIALILFKEAGSIMANWIFAGIFVVLLSSVAVLVHDRIC